MLKREMKNFIRQFWDGLQPQGKLTKNTPLFTVENFKSNPMMKKSAKHMKRKRSNVFKIISDMSRPLS
jgi:hypothetical protein